jgi:UDP-N-acetylmuramoylalanine--D-glutamate ligase
MDLVNKKIVVVGLGSSGVATAQFLRNRGAAVTATDVAAESDLSPAALSLRERGVHLELGGHQLKTFETADLVVTSPGVPHTAAPLSHARSHSTTVMGEMELAARFVKEPIVAITGTNGKTTTTTLVGEMLTRSGFNVFVGGNIGTPLISYVDRNEKAHIVVVEVSSFQLDTIDRFHANVAVLLNIAEDHLDRYPDIDTYARSKARIFNNQGPDDVAVINCSDTRIAALTAGLAARRFSFSRNVTGRCESVAQGAVITEDAIVFDPRIVNGMQPADVSESLASEKTVIPFSAIKLFGRHNQENTAAAALAVFAAGGNMAGIKAALKGFAGLQHRLEFVATVGGVRFYNDSKATNVDAVVRALESFSEPVVLLLGGRNKGGDFTILADSVRRGVKHLILFGEARNEIDAALNGIVSAVFAQSMAEMVAKAVEISATGDVVLFSPGCASFDMYENYARRGVDFRRCVEKLKKAA